MALVAIVSTSGPTLAQSSAPDVLAKAPPTYLLSARGLSVNGFFDNSGSSCSKCDNPGYCGCFLANASSGGNGFFQFSNSSTTPMTWQIELDFNYQDYNVIQTTLSTVNCLPTSGAGEGFQQAGRKVNDFFFETTGMICGIGTGTGGGTFTGSYILEGGTGAYSNATGSGNLTMGVYPSESDAFVNQIQFTGNIGQ
jgi:hypothetical protein